MFALIVGSMTFEIVYQASSLTTAPTAARGSMSQKHENNRHPAVVERQRSSKKQQEVVTDVATATCSSCFRRCLGAWFGLRGDHCMSARQDPRGALIAAEIALGEGELTTAEEAALEALSRIRYQQQEGQNDE